MKMSLYLIYILTSFAVYLTLERNIIIDAANSPTTKKPTTLAPKVQIKKTTTTVNAAKKTTTNPTTKKTTTNPTTKKTTTNPTTKKTTAKPTTKKPATTTKKPEPKFNPCQQPDGFFPHPKDCTKYYQCVLNVGYEKKCPLQLHFSPTQKLCDEPDAAGCANYIP